MADRKSRLPLRMAGSRLAGVGLRRTLPRAAWAAMAAAAAAVIAAATPSFSWRPLLLWNASASSPVGLYIVYPPGRPRAGDMVIAWAPAAARRLAAARGYLPASVPLVKRVAAADGDRVCARGESVSVNGPVVAVRRARDPSGRRLPWWSGCARLGTGDLLLLSNAAAAFDGRYFGITRAREVLGRARLIWGA